MLPLLTVLAASLALPLLEPGTGREDPRLARADSLVEAGRLGEALQELEGLLDQEPARYGALWRAASVAVALGVVADARGGPEEGRAWYERAGGWAGRAVQADRDGVEGRYWQVAALGRTALGAGRREAAGLADRIHEGALRVLELDPAHAGAHNALGRLYHEIMLLSGVSRFLGRTFLGGRALAEASWVRAETHLRRAVELEPTLALYRLDLGRLLLDRGDRTGAAQELRPVAESRSSHPLDRVFAEEARRLLGEMGG